MMVTTTVRRIFAALTAALVLGAVAEGMRRRRRSVDEDEIFNDEPPPQIPPARERTGTPSDRGHRAAYALDIERLRGEQGFEPVVEYLTYVQSQRGDGSHLLFVRYDDLDTLARNEGQEVTSFLERLDQLGVVVSNN